MFTDIKNLLFHPSQCMTSKYAIGIIETKADSSFLLHHFLSYYLKENCNVVFLSFCQSFNHFNSVGIKIGNNLTQARDLKQFLFLDGLRGLAQSVNPNSIKGDNNWLACVKDGGRIDIKSFYETLKGVVDNFKAGTDKKSVLIIDSLSVLVDIGVQAKDVITLIHYLKQYMTKQMNGSFVFGVSNDLGEQDEEGDRLKKFVQHTVDLSLEVKGLETGYCKDVHGQLDVKWYNSAAREIPASRTSQYKLTDKTCAVFASGMSSAVL